jgi:DNA repair exonuclease SbcCD nuclease subunit
LRIIHAADLHLTTKADKDYGLSVLREIVEIAMRDDCDLLVFSGDVFDTFDCLDQLRAPVREIVGSYQGKTLMIPGNHEDLGRASRDFAAYDLGSLQVLTAKPFSLQMIMTRSGPLEVLAIPHQN